MILTKKWNPVWQVAATLLGVELHDADVRVLRLLRRRVLLLDLEQHRKLKVHARQRVEHRLGQYRLQKIK